MQAMTSRARRCSEYRLRRVFQAVKRRVIILADLCASVLLEWGVQWHIPCYSAPHCRLAVVPLRLVARASPAPNARPSAGAALAGCAGIGYGANTATIGQTRQLVGFNWRNFDAGSRQTVDFRSPRRERMAPNRGRHSWLAAPPRLPRGTPTYSAWDTLTSTHGGLRPCLPGMPRPLIDLPDLVQPHLQSLLGRRRD